MNKLPSDTVITFWSVLLAFSLGATGWVVWKINSNASSVQSLLGEIEQTLQLNNSLEKFKVISKESRQQHIKIDTYLVSEDKAVNFVEQLEAIGKEQSIDVKIDSLEEKPIGPQNRSVLSLNVIVKGPWQKVMRTVDLIETMPHKTDITTLQLRRLDGDGGMWEGNFTVNVAMTK